MLILARVGTDKSDRLHAGVDRPIELGSMETHKTLIKGKHPLIVKDIDGTHFVDTAAVKLKMQSNQKQNDFG